ncbi:MAG: FtsX-like permease family protein, partial [Burkholderiales bacterium]|nr:FtsX-like permease family protein [Burkholderiales bacterium]
QPMARLAVSRLRAYPSQAAVSLAAIVAATSLLVAMVIMVTSFRASLTDWLDGVLPADLYLRAAEAGDSAFLSWVDQQRIAAVPGIDRVEFLRWSQIVLDERQPRVTLLARDGVEADAERRLPVVGPIVPPPAGMPAVWPSEAAASLQGLVAGQVLDIPLGGRMHRFHVAGLWRDYARQNGAVLIDRATYRALTADDTANDAGIWLRSGASLSTVRAALDAIAPGGVVLMAPDDIRRRSLDVFDRTFAVTYVLEVAALLIGLLGLSAAIAAEVLSRRREFGMLRHIGVTRRQIAALLGIEGVTVAGVGLVVGCVVGFGMSLILIHVVNRQSFHWGMELHVPWGALAAFVIGMLVLAAATAIGSGRQAMSGDVVQAVREDA